METWGEWFGVVSVAQGGLVLIPRMSALPHAFPGNPLRNLIGTNPLQHHLKLIYFKIKVLNVGNNRTGRIFRKLF